jgi:WD40 repeat protein
MSRAVPAGTSESALALLRQMDQLCDEFEEAWLHGRRPRIEEYLANVPEAARPTLLDHLLRVELEYRLRDGEQPAAAEYAARFPEQALAVRARLESPAGGGAEPSSTGTLHGGPAGTGGGGEATAPPPLPRPGIPGYELLEELGRGGMGVVYKARDVVLNRPVALKMILAGAYASERERARFRVEAEAVARLRHPNVVQIYDVGEEDGRPYLALEFAEGGSLADLLNGTPQPADPTAALVEVLARAVHAAHRAGVVHRDLKPANILLTEDGTPKVTDFGLAKQADQDSARTGTGTIVGTPSYMAPEQAAGQPAAVGPAADVYALGAILYEALTGQPPFKAATALETLEQVRTHEVAPPRRLRPQVPRDLETICLKCLQKDPRHRYASAAALADDLHAYLERRPIQARPPRFGERFLKWVQRRPAVAALAAAVVCVTGVAVGLVDWKQREAADLRNELTIEQGQRREVAGLRIQHSLDEGRQLCAEGDLARGMLRLAHVLETLSPDDADLNRAIRQSLAAWGRRLHTLKGVLAHPGAVENAVFSPDGRLVATVGGNGGVLLWDVATGRRIGKPLHHTGEVTCVGFRPDGRLLATGGADGTVRLWEPATAKQVGHALVHAGPVRGLVFRPDNATLLTAADRELRLCRVDNGTTLARAPSEERFGALDLTRDGKTAVTGSVNGHARVWDVDTLKPTGQPLPAGSTPVKLVRFSPDGKTLLTLCADVRDRGESALRLWQVGPGKPKHLATLRQHYAPRVAVFSPDGHTVATGSESHTAQFWAASDKNKNIGKTIGQPLPHQDAVTTLAFSPDGKTLLTGSHDRTARLWEVATGRPIGQPLEHDGPVLCVAFDATGHTLLTAGKDGAVRLWRPAPLTPYDREFKHAGQVMALAVSPDGLMLATGSDDGRVWRFRLAGGERLGHALRHSDDVWAVGFSPDGRTLLTGSRDRSARLWEAATGRPLKRLPQLYKVRAAAFARDGHTLLIGGGQNGQGGARLWDRSTERYLDLPQEGHATVWQAAFRPDGTGCAVAADDNAVRVWDLATRRLLCPPLVHHDRVAALAYRPDGRVLLTGSIDKTARRWDLTTGEPVGKPLRHSGAVWAVAWSPDGRTLATGGRDNAAHLWDAATGLPLGPPLAHGDVVWALAFQPGGHLVFSGSGDKTVRAWQVPEPVEGDAERVRLWVQVETGMELDAGGTTASRLNAAAWAERAARLGKHTAVSRAAVHQTAAK